MTGEGPLSTPNPAQTLAVYLMVEARPVWASSPRITCYPVQAQRADASALGPIVALGGTDAEMAGAQMSRV